MFVFSLICHIMCDLSLEIKFCSVLKQTYIIRLIKEQYIYFMFVPMLVALELQDGYDISRTDT